LGRIWGSFCWIKLIETTVPNNTNNNNIEKNNHLISPNALRRIIPRYFVDPSDMFVGRQFLRIYAISSSEISNVIFVTFVS
jgi:hypothetical protein